MAHYTTTIRTLIDNNFNFELDEYPIFDETYRETLNQNILNHYYNDEIGFETASLFRFHLKARLNEIMPYYNNLYKIQAKILENAGSGLNFKEIISRETSGESESKSTNNSESSGNSKNLFQDTPQGRISQASINNQEWATNVTMNQNSNSNDSTIEDKSSTSGSEDVTRTTNLDIDTFNRVIENIRNIDLQIINNLNDLFMGIY